MAKKLACLVLAMSTTTLVAAVEVRPTERVPLVIAGHKVFYTVSRSDDLTWDEAMAACARVGLTTAIIANKDENDAINKIARKRAKKNEQNQFHIGAYQNKKGYWAWAANNQRLTYTNWASDAVETFSDPEKTAGWDQCGYITGSGKWGTWACALETAAPLCQDKLHS